MKPPFPSPTAEWHDDTYPAIDPKRPELSVKGKTVVISGGGAGIGRGIAQAFADAGASSIAILGRRQAVLEQARNDITATNRHVTIGTYAADVTDGAALQTAARAIGPWDILVSNAGYSPALASVLESNAGEWWKTFEINVQGSFNLLQAFLPTRRPDAVVVSVNAGSIQVPGAFSRNHSAYNSSKFATLKLFETLAVEHPDIHVVSIHPGVVETDMHAKSEFKAPHIDTLELPSHFTVWLCSAEARFLRGKFVWVNWDVEELIAKKPQIEESLLFTANCIGWPFDA